MSAPPAAVAYEAVIGLEVHAQLRTATKIFCGCRAEFGAEPNAHVCPVCLGLPGALPVMNAHAVDLAVAAALALGCDVHSTSVFARKNYFYPDLPKGYQISQYERPLATGGRVVIDAGQGPRAIALTRIHLEEDAGKSLHDGFADSDRRTYVDFNRAGVPLIEIVSEPDLRSATEAATYFETLRRLLVWIGVNDGNMEEGSLRCDANVSVRPAGRQALGTKAEVKNVNSFRYLQKAIEYEIARQIDLVGRGGRVEQETRLFDAALGKTFSMRSKEEAHDYRYFPEPDLPPLTVSAERQARVAAALPELPEARRARFVARLQAAGLRRRRAHRQPTAGRLFRSHRARLRQCQGGEQLGDGRGAAHAQSAGDDHRPGRGQRRRPGRADRARRRRDDQHAPSPSRCSSRWTAPAAPPPTSSPSQGLAQVSDDGALSRVVTDVLAAHGDAVQQYRAGKKAAFGYLVGEAMKASGGNADPRRLSQLLRSTLDG